jgi:hypothetical protein
MQQLPIAPPDLCYTNPTDYGGEDCSFEVDADIIIPMLSEYELDPMLTAYISEEFGVAASYAMELIENPVVKFENVWSIFTQLKNIMVEMRDFKIK